jgi:hypothetical protein
VPHSFVPARCPGPRRMRPGNAPVI